MKLSKIVATLFIIIFVTGCSLQSFTNNQDESQTKTISEESDSKKRIDSKNDLFNQKLKCSNKLDDILKIIKENNNSESEESLEEIFYSPSLNTCLYSSAFSSLIGNKWYVISYDIYDALTLENLYSFYLLDYDENYMKDDMAYLRVAYKVRNHILKDKMGELKK